MQDENRVVLGDFNYKRNSPILFKRSTGLKGNLHCIHFILIASTYLNSLPLLKKI